MDANKVAEIIQANTGPLNGHWQDLTDALADYFAGEQAVQCNVCEGSHIVLKEVDTTEFKRIARGE